MSVDLPFRRAPVRGPGTRGDETLDGRELTVCTGCSHTYGLTSESDSYPKRLDILLGSKNNQVLNREVPDCGLKLVLSWYARFAQSFQPTGRSFTNRWVRKRVRLHHARIPHLRGVRGIPVVSNKELNAEFFGQRGWLVDRSHPNAGDNTFLAQRLCEVIQRPAPPRTYFSTVSAHRQRPRFARSQATLPLVESNGRRRLYLRSPTSVAIPDTQVLWFESRWRHGTRGSRHPSYSIRVDDPFILRGEEAIEASLERAGNP